MVNGELECHFLGIRDLFNGQATIEKAIHLICGLAACYLYKLLAKITLKEVEPGRLILKAGENPIPV